MPNNVVKSPRDEYKWKRAEQIAAKAGRKGDYAYVMGIYKNMKPDHQFKKSASERDWVRIAGDILTHAAWDSEKVAAAFNAELERIELEKEAAKRMGQRQANKIVQNVLKAERAAQASGGKIVPYKGPSYRPEQVTKAFRSVGRSSVLREMGTLSKNKAVKGSINVQKASRGPVTVRPDSRMGDAAARGYKPTIYETPGGRRVSTPKGNTLTEKVIQTPKVKPKSTQDVAKQTNKQLEQARAAAPRTPQSQKGGKTLEELGYDIPRYIKSRRATPEIVAGAPTAGEAANAFSRAIKNTSPRQFDAFLASNTGRSPLARSANFPRANNPPTPNTPADTVGRSAKRSQPAPKSEVSGATGAAFREEAKRIPVARQLATSGKPLPSGSPSAMETVRGGREAATVRPAKTQEAINRVRAGEQTADDLARVGVKPNLKQRLSQTKDRAEAGVRKKIDARASAKRQKRQESAAVAAQKAQVAKVKGELKQVDAQIRSAVAAGDNQAMSQLAGQKQILERELKQMGASAPRAPKPAAQQPVAQQPTAPAELANRKPAPTAPATSTAPAQAPATPVQQAASQSPGFWQQAKNTWGSMSQNQRLLAVGVGGVGAGMVTSPKKQPTPPMYGPAPQAPQYYQMAPQPPAFR